jgi:hypothetical protein
VKKFKWLAEKNVVCEGGLWVFKSGCQKVKKTMELSPKNKNIGRGNNLDLHSESISSGPWSDCLPKLKGQISSTVSLFSFKI